MIDDRYGLCFRRVGQEPVVGQLVDIFTNGVDLEWAKFLDCIKILLIEGA